MRTSSSFSVLFLLLIASMIIMPNANFAMAEYQSVSVSARGEDSMRFYLNDGDKMKYTISVSGGKNDDIVVDIKNPYGGTEVTKGRVVGSFSSTINADTDGYYVFEFDNTISIISKKQVSLNYEIIKKPILSNIYESDNNSASPSIPFGIIILGIIRLIIIVPIVIIISKSRKSYKVGKEEGRNSKQSPFFHCVYCGLARVHIEDIKKHTLTCDKNPNYEKNNPDLKNIGILKERLAKGEITKKEYDELKKEFE